MPRLHPGLADTAKKWKKDYHGSPEKWYATRVGLDSVHYLEPPSDGLPDIMDSDHSMPREYWLGHPSIDAQHEVLFALYEEISRSLDGNAESFAVDYVFSGLRTYVRTHFKFEETLMDRSSYVERPLHMKEHHLLEEEVEAIVDRFFAARSPDEKRIVTQETRAFLYRWLTDHITKIDKKFCATLSESVDA
ncbi:MAG: bacteriohemerythrin [Magnetococcales bacterium]|nr:bacteriohemerythrin [Magnetococcales bacterium]